MNDLLDKLEEIFRISAQEGFVALMAGTARTILTADRRSITGFCRALFFAILAMILVANLMSSYDVPPGMKMFVVGMAAFMADDLFQGVLKISGAIRDNPLSAIESVINLFRKR